MLAPEDKYISNAVATESASEPVTTVINRLAVPFLSIEDLKEAFYLDDLLMIEVEGDEVGFTGLVTLKGYNHRMHAPERIGSIRTDDGSGNEQACYLDAGLNTRGFSEVNQILSRYPNWIKLTAFFKSSLYADTETRGYQCSVNYGPWETTNNTFGGFPANTQIEPQDKIGAPAVFNDSIRVRTFITNPEGTSYSDPVEFFALQPLFYMTFVKRPSACSTEGVDIDIFMLQSDYDALADVTEVDTETDIKGYKDEDFNEEIEDGYYVEKSFATNYRSYFVAGGQFRRFFTCQTAPVTNRMYLYPSGLSGIAACTLGDDTTVQYQYLYYQGDFGVGTIFYRDEYLNAVAIPDTYSDQIMFLVISGGGVLEEIGSCTINN